MYCKFKCVVFFIKIIVSLLLSRYFVVQGQQQVKRCIKECAECNRRFRGCPAKQQMAPLPRIRLEMTWRPSANCATDFAGPFCTMQGQGRLRMKHYLCLFWCLQTHALLPLKNGHFPGNGCVLKYADTYGGSTWVAKIDAQ